MGLGFQERHGHPDDARVTRCDRGWRLRLTFGATVRERRPLRAAALLLVCLGIGLRPGLAGAQTASTPPAESDSPEDPTKAVFFSLRNEFFSLSDGNWNNAFIFRFDRAVLRSHPTLGGKVGLLTRFDVPIVFAARTDTRFNGLGDLYGQALYVPFITPRFALAMGGGLGVPTATEPQLGSGKWQAAPLVAPVWFLPRRRGFFLIRFHEHVSFAGDEDRLDINNLEIVPLLFRTFKRTWWTLVDTNMLIDFELDYVSWRTGIEIGHVIRRTWGVSVKPEIPWGPNQRGDWKVIVFVTRYRGR